jgi:hypothetical protein
LTFLPLVGIEGISELSRSVVSKRQDVALARPRSAGCVSNQHTHGRGPAGNGIADGEERYYVDIGD